MVANGDCLPGTGSVFAFGTDCHTMEIRARIVMELVLYKDYYLTDSNLIKGLEVQKKLDETKKAFAFYSDEYIYSDVVTENLIEQVFGARMFEYNKTQILHGYLADFCTIKRPSNANLFCISTAEQ